MNCDDTNLSAYLDDELPALERRAVEAHLRSCPDCAATLKDLERVRTMLLTQAVPMGLHGPVIDRIRDEEKRIGARKRLVVAAVAAMLVAVAALAVVFYGFHAPNPGSPDGQLPLIANGSDDRTTPERPMLAQDTTSNSETPSQPDTTVMAETKLPLTLTGTLLGGDPQAVLVHNDSGEQHIYRPGDTVLDGVVLREVQQGSVVLDNHGTPEMLAKVPSQGPTRPSLNGKWQLAYMIKGAEAEYGPVISIQDADGALTITGPDLENPLKGQLEGRTVTIDASPVGYPTDLHGDFNNSFTEVVLRSPSLTGFPPGNTGHLVNADDYSIKLTRFDTDSQVLDPRAIRQARQDELRAMYVPLKQYAQANQGQFPGSLAQLVPQYVQSLELYADRQDRSVSYRSGLKEQDLSQIEPTPNCSRGGDVTQALLNHEAKLQQFWGGPIPVAPVLLEVTYSDPDEVWTVTVQGGVSGRSTLGGVSQSGDSVAQWQAMVASDQNNLKQMGLVNKMFQNENCDYTIPGFCTVYPEYLTDPAVLTSPWDAPGTASYEMLFPAAHQQDLEALGEEIVAAKGGSTDPDANPALSAMAESEVPLMFDKTEVPAFGDRPAGRNVLYLDGHVQFLARDEFEKRVGPFLR